MEQSLARALAGAMPTASRTSSPRPSRPAQKLLTAMQPHVRTARFGRPQRELTAAVNGSAS